MFGRSDFLLEWPIFSGGGLLVLGRVLQTHVCILLRRFGYILGLGLVLTRFFFGGGGVGGRGKDEGSPNARYFINI